MTWTEGDQWLLTLDLPPGRHHFKVVVAQAATGCYDWEAGPNRTLQVRGMACRASRRASLAPGAHCFGTGAGTDHSAGVGRCGGRAVPAVGSVPPCRCLRRRPLPAAPSPWSASGATRRPAWRHCLRRSWHWRRSCQVGVWLWECVCVWGGWGGGRASAAAPIACTFRVPHRVCLLVSGAEPACLQCVQFRVLALSLNLRLRTQGLDPGPPLPALLAAGTESDEPALRPEDLSAEPYSPNGERAVAAVGREASQGHSWLPGQVGPPSCVVLATVRARQPLPCTLPAGESPVSVVGKMTMGSGAASKQKQPVSRGREQQGAAAAAQRGDAATAPAAGTPVKVVRKGAARGTTAAAKKGHGEPGSGGSRGRGRPAADTRAATEGRLAAEASTPAERQPRPPEDRAAAEDSKGATHEAAAKQGGAPPQAVSMNEQATAVSASKGQRGPAPIAGNQEGPPAPANNDQHAPVGLEAGDFPSQTPVGAAPSRPATCCTQSGSCPALKVPSSAYRCAQGPTDE